MYRNQISILLILSLIFFISLTACDKNTGNTDDNNGIDSTKTPEPFDKVPTLDDMVLYEVNFMAFGPGCSINDVTLRLDSIKDLGVNVLWLMPLYSEGELNGVGSPYCVRDYEQVNPDLGTLSDLKTLVNEAHEREMAVILDWVANHTAWDNWWIDNTDWYTQDGSGNIISPPGTNYYDVADLNFQNAQMRLEMIISMKYWITTCNIDGFRCDAADKVPFSFWKQAIDSLRTLPGRDLVLLAEGSRTDHFTAGFQMTYAWDFQTTLKNIFHNGAAAGTIFQTHTNEYVPLPVGTHKLRYITNHDIYAWEDSPVTQFINENGSLSAFVATAFIGGVPLICSGQEVAENNTISFFDPSQVNWTQNVDIHSKYKKVMQIRESLSAVHGGNLISYNNDDVLVFKRKDTDSEVLIMVNVRNTTITLDLPEEISNSIWQNQWDQTELELGTEVVLPPFEFILAKRNV